MQASEIASATSRVTTTLVFHPMFLTAIHHPVSPRLPRAGWVPVAKEEEHSTSPLRGKRARSSHEEALRKGERAGALYRVGVLHREGVLHTGSIEAKLIGFCPLIRHMPFKPGEASSVLSTVSLSSIELEQPPPPAS